MQTLRQDLRFGARIMLKQPGFTLIVVLTIALGIGVNTAVFTVVNATLANGLPYRAPEELVHLWERTPQKDFPRREASYPDFEDWRQSQSLSGVAAYAGCGMTLNQNGVREALPCARVSANFFSVLGVEPMLGRGFLAEDEKPGAAKVLLLQYSAWQQRFGGDPGLIGRTLTIDNEAWTVIGILPPSFHFAPRGASEAWAPLVPMDNRRTNRRMHWVKIIGRLKTPNTFTQAQAELDPIGNRIAAQFPDSHTNTGIFIEPLEKELIGTVKPLMFALLAAVALVLLIACANVANLLLTRSATRQKEIAIRLALGARRIEIIRQLLIESLLLALLGGALGVLLARWGVDALVSAIPDVRLSAMPYLRNLTMDTRILAFTGGLTLLTGLVFGLLPALQASRPALQSVLKEGSRTLADGGKRAQQMLVVGEMALALMLLIGAGLMVRSAYRLLHFNPGFNPDNLLTLSYRVTGEKYESPEALVSFHQQALARLAGVPGVRGVSSIDVMPLVGGNTTRVYAAGKPIPPPEDMTEVNFRTASDDYFRILEIPMLQGRQFTSRDNAQAPPVVIINQSLAKRLFPNENAVGQRLVDPSDNLPEGSEIIAVVGDERLNGMDAALKPAMYVPFSQSPGSSAVLMIRTNGDPLQFSQTMRRELMALEPGAVIFFTRTMEDVAANQPAAFLRRYPALLLGVFAGLSLLLAAIGIYGVISYSVTQRTREIGVRTALGARPTDVLRMILGQGLRLTLGGIVLGLLAAIGLTRLLRGLLFGVSTTDPQTFAAVAGMLLLISILACWIPARRATKVDPMAALRQE